jgi:hypothetical protein
MFSVLWLAAGFCLGADRQQPVPPISISVCIPATGALSTNRVDSRSLSFGPKAHFHVLISNTSTNSVRLWDEWCSWGYGALSFQFDDKAGHRWDAKKVPTGWDNNFPRWWSFKPAESGVIDVYFADPKVWDGFRHATGKKPLTVTLSAVYEIRANKETAEYGIWTGRVVSPPIQIDVWD